MNWVDRFPERFAFELADFERRGLAFVLDEALLRREGVVTLRGKLEVDGEPAPVELVVCYPDSFPYFRPDVFAPDLDLGRHQNPIERNLCLLDRSTRAWDPTETAAHLVVTQVPHLLGLVRAGGDEMRNGEVPQGEPVSAFFSPLAGTFVLVPDELLELPLDAGRGVAHIAFPVAEQPGLRLRGLLRSASVSERGGRSHRIAEASSPLATRYAGTRTIEIGWVRVEELPRRSDAQALLDVAEAAVSGSTRLRWHQTSEGEIAVVGLVFREEVQHGLMGDQWLFVVQTRQRLGRQVQQGVYTTRGERFAISDLQARVPQLAPLQDRRVALVGLGALGAPLALELVRPGLGELRILDFDIVEAGTTVRWPFGVSATNAPKPEFLAQVLGREFPFTSLVPYNQTLGQVSLERRESDFDVLHRMFDGVDLVIDASAEIGIQQLVGSVADELGLPQLYLWATEGARGGIVARSFPEETGCWFCLQLALERGTVPIPPRDDIGTVQPRGCSSFTFTGASFDLAPIWAQAARVAASLLASGRRIGTDDVFVAALDGGLSAVPPIWTAVPLAREEGCPCCGAERVAA